MFNLLTILSMMSILASQRIGFGEGGGVPLRHGIDLQMSIYGTLISSLPRTVCVNVLFAKVCAQLPLLMPFSFKTFYLKYFSLVP